MYYTIIGTYIAMHSEGMDFDHTGECGSGHTQIGNGMGPYQGVRFNNHADQGGVGEGTSGGGRETKKTTSITRNIL